VTRSRAPKTHGHPRLAGACIVALAAFAMLPARGEAEPRPVDARIVWARADRAYIAAADSIALAPGDLLTVMKGKKSIAEGQVLQVLAHDLAAARITSGSLDRTKLDRLRIRAERPPLRALPLLRIGYPGRGYSLFDCTRAVPHVPDSTAYHTDSLAENAYQLVRAGGAAPWPDTILVRLFADGFDEEIALERGELDVAVFWPGELSARMRSDTRFREPSLGLRSRGVLVCVAGAGDTLAPPAADMEALNREAFAGDLQPWSGLAGPGPGEGPPARYTVDRTVPGAKHLERILTREARPGGARTLKLVYLDQLVMGGEAAGEAAREAWRAPGVTSLFAIRCPVLAQPEARAAVDAIGAHAFAEMAPCAEGTGK
jgi:hypothetical protein